MSADPTCIFCKIIAGQIPSRKAFEDDELLAFHDINPQAANHILIIPKGRHISYADFSANASDAEIAGLIRAVGHIARILGFDDAGYRILANMGEHAGQEVPHFHIHLFAGHPLGPMLARSAG